MVVNLSTLPVCLSAATFGTLLYCQPVLLQREKEGSTAMNGHLGLSSRISIENQQLVLRYAVTNRSNRDAYLLNRLYRTTPEWEMGPNVIYVHLDERTETVWLNKKLADIPEGVQITAPVAPFVTPVRIGAVFQEEVRISLPIREYQQYPAPDLQGARQATFKYVYFTVGYYWRPENTEEQAKDIRGTEVIVPKVPPGTRLEFGQLHTERIRMDLPVLLASKAETR